MKGPGDGAFFFVDNGLEGNMDISQRGVDFIVSFEGKKTLLPDGRYKSYLDTLAKPPVWTIWAGLTKGVNGSTCWTESQCEAQFAKELAIYEDAVEKYVKVPLNQNQFDALVSFVYNCGPGALQKSTLLKVLNQGKYSQVPAQLARWNKAGGKVWPGLTRRRAAEGALFMEPVEITEPQEIIVRDEEGEVSRVPETAMPQRVEVSTAPVTEGAARSPTVWSSLVGLISTAAGVIWQLVGTVATETTAEVGAAKQSLGGFEALWGALGISLPSVLAVVTIGALGVVLIRHVQRYAEGRA
jgi:lysozyme